VEADNLSDQFQFRDVFNPELVEQLAGNLASAWPPFDRQGFIDAIVPMLSKLNYGARAGLITEALHDFLPEDYPTAVGILLDALGPEPESDSLSGAKGFIIMPQCMFVSRYGLDHFEISTNALYEMTKRFTAEGEIRPFIERYPEKTLAFLRRLTEDPSPFARRLASEGTRPRLPLGSRLRQFQQDPTPVIELLDKLKADPNLMVRRSVANNLNDIAKDNPEIVVSTLGRWQAEDHSPEMAWVISHALRTLLKQGHPGALKLLGYDPEVKIEVSTPRLSNMAPAIGDKISFSFTVTSHEEKPSKLMIDYVIYFMKANGLQTPKVFKAAKKTLKPGEAITIEKKHSFQQRTTRIHYPGRHSLQVQINGLGYDPVDFSLRE
jgi:3-methyladenine DNA glycosylase AlkC